MIYTVSDTFNALMLGKLSWLIKSSVKLSSAWFECKIYTLFFLKFIF